MTTPDLSSEAEIVLAAIGEVSTQLQSAKASQEALRVELKRDADSRFRQTVALVLVVAILLSAGFLGYVQYDRVTRCHARADTIHTIKEVLATDHDALPKGLRVGFPPSDDLDKTIAVIVASYNASEKQIDALLPEPDCSGLLP